MTALTPHIRVLRAQADSLERVAAVELNEIGQIVLTALVRAKRAAADILEAEEPKLPEEEYQITYDPRGKR